MSKRLLLLSGLAFGLLILGLATMNRALLAMVLPLLALLGAALLERAEERPALRCTRTLSADRVFAGTPVTVRLTVTNEGPPLAELLLRDQVPPPLRVTDGETSLLTALPSGASAELVYTVQTKRGDPTFDLLEATAYDRLGLGQNRVTVSVPAQLLVLPQAPRLRRVTIRPRRTRAYAGPIPSRRGGSGGDFFSLREYRPGDPLRRINWRASARHPQELYTTEFERERIADVGLILDGRSRSDVQVAGDSLFEHAIRATAALAESFLSDGNRVGLLVYGQVLDWTFPGYGSVQRERILRSLARAETGDSLIFDSLRYLPARFFPPRSQVVIVSPLFRDDLPALIRLRAWGYRVLAVSPDPVSFARQGEERAGTALAARIRRLERELLLRSLRQAGARIVDWQVAQPLEQTIHASLDRSVHHSRLLGAAA